ncbi:MAG: tRNA uridine(34) 5-carboxymethylaminomethyl modification radical SAM/GNAT enzyme Elp3 [Anaerolineales bacterium]|jgi:elongator complex protein 3|nr:tRNA uridine(34) 5-carboxymethylaminomethyl modification radical SAM/GNAT enzyme Elp3 [Anaerolineales bacterium]
MERKAWIAARTYSPETLALARQALEDMRRGREVASAVQRHPLPGGGYLAKHALVAAYRQLVESGEWPADPALLERIRMKPVRTLSGVTTVTVLTGPYPCPGECVFCPTDVRMPKSYLPDEPGARRALDHQFDPYDQVKYRIEALEAVGHPTDKIELLVLGGTWSAYRRDYQEWFLRRCFEAMNGQEADTLEQAHITNETAPHRNVGLVIETRPDEVNARELAWLRRLGVTKVQMGAQSLDDSILARNRRGHTLADTRRAVALLRAAGFKIVLHWMPNLLGASIQSDREDFARLWQGLCPDEIKIYPTQLLANAELYAYWLRGEYQPYSTEQLVNLIADIKPSIPRYCRVNRVIRDIPSTNVVEGNKRTSLRQDVQDELQRRGTACTCIRCREVRKQSVNREALRLDDLVYHADAPDLSGTCKEHFLSFVTPDDLIAGFLRLSLPEYNAASLGLADLQAAAIIREVHVYGQSLQVGSERAGAAQHAGLGTQLIEAAAQIAAQRGYQQLAVIAAVGTRKYYLERGFERGELYLVRQL